MTWAFIRGVAWRTAAFLLVFELVFAGLNLESVLGKLSLYNGLVPGRERFPFGENPAQSYNVSVYNLNALFASHEINGALPKPVDEYRVLLIGDSSIWGTLLRPEETLAGQLEAQGLTAPDGKHMRFYNLGYPTMSTLKDLLILERSMQYQPDLVLWSVTLESLVKANQFNSPLVTNNLAAARTLAREYELDFNPPVEEELEQPGLLNQGIMGRRRDLADLVRLQIYGLLWAATGRDQYYPPVFSLAQRDFEPDDSYHNLTAPLEPDDLALDALRAGFAIAGDTPVLLVNEPIMVSSGENSDIRYNFYYPRWAYDSYQAILAEEAAARGWMYLNQWDGIFESEFTNTAVHLSPFGVSQQAALFSGVLPEVARAGRLPVAASAVPEAAVPPAVAVVEAAGPAGVNDPAGDAEDTAKAPSVIDRLTPEPTLESVEGLLPTPTVDAALAQAASVVTAVCENPEENWQAMPVIPGYVSERALEVYRTGLEQGTQPNALSVIGDCQSVPQVFLGVFEKPEEYDLGEQYAYLKPTIDHFNGSYNRKGQARLGGLNVAAVLSPLRTDPKQCIKGETPLKCELRLNRPSIVVVSLEEWWSQKPVEVYEAYLRQVLDEIIAAGAVPILSTKADNLEGDHAINRTIVKLACEYQLPVWNFWAAVQPLPNHGLWTDGFHLTTSINDFDNPNVMRNARPTRNLTGLQAIDSVWRLLSK